jgi:hypothetical protein
VTNVGTCLLETETVAGASSSSSSFSSSFSPISSKTELSAGTATATARFRGKLRHFRGRFHLDWKPQRRQQQQLPDTSTRGSSSVRQEQRADQGEINAEKLIRSTCRDSSGTGESELSPPRHQRCKRNEDADSYTQLECSWASQKHSPIARQESTNQTLSGLDRLGSQGRITAQPTPQRPEEVSVRPKVLPLPQQPEAPVDREQLLQETKKQLLYTSQIVQQLLVDQLENLTNQKLVQNCGNSTDFTSDNQQLPTTDAMSRNSTSSRDDRNKATPTLTPDAGSNITTASISAEEFLVPRPALPRAFVPMPSPGTYGAPIFDGNNATRFFNGFEILAEDHGLQRDGLVDRVLLYCTPEVERVISSFPEAYDRDWVEFRRVVQEEYKSQDEKELASTREYLNRLYIKSLRTLP